MRPAEACLRPSIVISSSMMPSETGGHEGVITKTSASRTFSSIWTSMFSLEKRTTVVWQRSAPRHLLMASASSGWAVPLISLMAPIMSPPLLFTLCNLAYLDPYLHGTDRCSSRQPDQPKPSHHDQCHDPHGRHWLNRESSSSSTPYTIGTIDCKRSRDAPLSEGLADQRT